MRPYNHWLFHEHFELVMEISQLYQKMPGEELLAAMNVHFPKPFPPPELAGNLNLPPWSRYDIDSLVDDFCLFFRKS